MQNNKQKIKLYYVCDFSSIHARHLIEFFAEKVTDFHITVISTNNAKSMPNVNLICLNNRPTFGNFTSNSLIPKLIYYISCKIPKLYSFLRLRQEVKFMDILINKANMILPQLEKPDIIHDLRNFPEGAISLLLLQKFPNTPLFLTTWGQDLVLWSKGNKKIRELTDKLLKSTCMAIPDNQRDANIIKNLTKITANNVFVMPATGGINHQELAIYKNARINLQGNPKILSTRGFNGLYVKCDILLDALKIFLLAYPEAHLYIDGPSNHPGRYFLNKKIKQLRLANHVTITNLDRPGLLTYMNNCDMYVSATTSDGLPMSLLESLYFNQIPIIHNLDSISPPIEHGVNGILYNRIEPNEIANAWKEGYKLISTYQQRAIYNQELINRDYQRDINLFKLKELYISQNQYKKTM